MGRTEPSVGQPPATFRRDARAKRAKATKNQVIPSLLATHPRAQKGIDAAELIVNPPSVEKSSTAASAPASASASASDGESCGPRISLRVADTLVAAHTLIIAAESAASPPTTRKGGSNGSSSKRDDGSRVAILNMASELRPGGGFLNGAASQEESLCMRTTLLPSLKDDFYRLPEMGAVYTPDVLVFRGGGDEGGDETLLGKKDRWFVDCISAAMLRSPEIDYDEKGRGVYALERDRETVLAKARMVLRICQTKGIARVVLGAWGCGAYGNPVNEVAAAWKKVLLPRKGNRKGKNNKETWSGMEEVVFAIKDAGMAEAFATAFGDGLVRDEGEVEEVGQDDDEEEDREQVQRRELQERIGELEARIEATTNSKLKTGLESILAGLVSQLPPGDSAEEEEKEEEEDKNE